MPLAALSTLINATSQNLFQLKSFAAIYHLLQGGTPSIDGLTTLINANNSSNFGSMTATNPGPTFNEENVFINIANALFQGNTSAQTAFNNLAAGVTLSDKLTSVYNSLVDPSQQSDDGRTAFAAQSAFYAARAIELGIPGDTGGAVVGFAALLNILVRENNVGIGNSVNDLVMAINDGSAALPEMSATFIPIETADGTKFDSDDSPTNTITLTTNADTPGAASPSANTLGTASTDTYVGLFDPTGNATTLSNADTLDGAGGTSDTLNLRIASVATGGSTVAPMSSNVELFNLTNQATTDVFTLDFTNIAGETMVSDKSSVSGANTRAINVDPTATLAMENTMGFFEVNFSGDRSGATDAFTLALNGAGTATKATNFSTITTSGAVDNTFEIANISSTSTLSNISLGVDPMTLKTINVTGDAMLTLAGHNNFVGLSTVDASGMTGGGLHIDARDSTESGFSFKGSTTDDRVVLKNTTINTAGTLDGGGGKDTLATLSLANLTATAVNSAASFEVLERIGGTQSVDVSTFTGINEFLFSGTASTNSATISNVESSDIIALSSDVNFGGNVGLRLEGKNAGTQATLELRAVDGTNGETVVFAQSNNNDVNAVDLRTNIASLKVDSTGTNTNANLIEANQSGSDFAYAFNNTTTPIFTITGSQDLTIMAKAGTDVSDGSRNAGFSTAVNVDASTFTGELRIAGSLSADVIKGGTSNDIIYSLGGADMVTGNGGSDQFRLAEFFNTTDTVTDFQTGQDKVGLNQFDFTNTTATQAGATLSATDYIENRNDINAIGNGDAMKVIEIQSALTDSQITNDTGAAVEAFVLVYNSTSGKGELWYDNDWSTASNRDKVITFDNVVDLTGVTSFSNTDFVEYTF